MDYASCHVIYVDNKAREDIALNKDGTNVAATGTHISASSYLKTAGELNEVHANIQAILTVFDQGTWIV